MFPTLVRFFPPDFVSVEDSAGGGWRPRSCSWWPSLNLLKGHCNHLRKVMVKNCHGMWILKRKKYFWVELLEWIYWNHPFEGWNSFWGIPLSGGFDCYLIWHSSPRFIPSFLRRWLQPFEKYCQLKNLRKDWGWKLKKWNRHLDVYLPGDSKWPKLFPKGWRLPTSKRLWKNTPHPEKACLVSVGNV